MPSASCVQLDWAAWGAGSHDDAGDEEEADLGTCSSPVAGWALRAAGQWFVVPSPEGMEGLGPGRPCAVVTRLRCVWQDCITFLQDPRVTSSLEDHRVKYLQVSSRCCLSSGLSLPVRRRQPTSTQSADMLPNGCA